VIDETPDGSGVVLKVHQETDSLIFKGPASVAADVESAIQSIAERKASSPDSAFNSELENAEIKLARLRAQESEMAPKYSPTSPEMGALLADIARVEQRVTELKQGQSKTAAAATQPSK
jgi:hypothetical protein